MMMINGALGGMRTLLWSMVLIAVPIYAVALVLRESVGEFADQAADGGQANGAEYFATLGLAWFTMFRCVVAGECTTEEGKPVFVLVTKHFGWGLGVVYCFVVMLMTFGLFNVITALYVENTVAAAKYNSLHQKRQRLLDSQMFAERIKQLVEFIWHVHTNDLAAQAMTSRDSGTGSIASLISHFRGGAGVRISMNSDDVAEVLQDIQITPELFDHLRSYREFQDLLTDLDVSDEDQLDLFETLDVDGGGTIDLEELIVGICKLRGDARRSDIVGVSLIARSLQGAVTRFEESAMELLRNQSDTLHSLAKKAAYDKKCTESILQGSVVDRQSLSPSKDDLNGLKSGSLDMQEASHAEGSASIEPRAASSQGALATSLLHTAQAAQGLNASASSRAVPL